MISSTVSVLIGAEDGLEGADRHEKLGLLTNAALEATALACREVKGISDIVDMVDRLAFSLEDGKVKTTINLKPCAISSDADGDGSNGGHLRGVRTRSETK